jgi:hypothetical protein
MTPDFSFIEINKGIDPTISITANKVKMTVTSSLKLNCIKKALYEDTKPFLDLLYFKLELNLALFSLVVSQS